jgi:putative FmdB family regulatory protein
LTWVLPARRFGQIAPTLKHFTETFRKGKMGSPIKKGRKDKTKEATMPIYEFFCKDCNTIFSFFSRNVNTDKRPLCPKCKTRELRRQVSVFAVTGKAREDSDTQDLPFDEGKMEQAMQVLAKEADRIDENDPRQAADLMRKLTDMTGMQLGSGMQEAIDRMARGEDPDQVEADMGEILEQEDPFVLSGKKGGAGPGRRPSPYRDETLYDLV